MLWSRQAARSIFFAFHHEAPDVPSMHMGEVLVVPYIHTPRLYNDPIDGPVLLLQLACPPSRSEYPPPSPGSTVGATSLTGLVLVVNH